MMKTVREEKAGNFILRLLRSPTGEHKGVVVKPKGGTLGPFAGPDADTVWTRLQDEAARVNGAYIGFDAARLRFERFFPGGFTDARYMTDERTYKLAAKALLDTALRWTPPGMARVMVQPPWPRSSAPTCFRLLRW